MSHRVEPAYWREWINMRYGASQPVYLPSLFRPTQEAEARRLYEEYGDERLRTCISR